MTRKVQVPLGQPSSSPEHCHTEKRGGADAKRRGCLARSGEHAVRQQVVAAALRLRALLRHLPAVWGAGVLQHRAAGGGAAAARHAGPDGGVPEPQLRQRRVPRALSAQSAEGQQVRRVRHWELLWGHKLGPAILHVLCQHPGHHSR